MAIPPFRAFLFLGLLASPLAHCSSDCSDGAAGLGNRTSPARPDAKSTIRVQSSLVLVDVTSLDRKNGLPIRDFRKEDFRVLDNRHDVPIASLTRARITNTRPVIL